MGYWTAKYFWTSPTTLALTEVHYHYNIFFFLFFILFLFYPAEQLI